MPSDRLFDDEPRDEVGRVDHAFALLLRCAGRRRGDLRGGLLVLDVGDRLLENVAENVDRYLAFEIVIGDCGELFDQVIGQAESVDQRIRAEQATVVLWDIFGRTALVDPFEQLQHFIPFWSGKMAVRLGQGVRKAALGQKVFVFGKRDEQHPVQKRLHRSDAGLDANFRTSVTYEVYQVAAHALVGDVEFVCDIAFG